MYKDAAQYGKNTAASVKQYAGYWLNHSIIQTHQQDLSSPSFSKQRHW
jgi:hypothetical protein